MITEKMLKEEIAVVLDDVQAMDMVTIDIRKQTSIADIMIICTGRSSRHVKAIAEKLMIMGKKLKGIRTRAEGMETAEWVLLDLGDIIVHIMQADTRQFYQLETLWNPSLDNHNDPLSVDE